MKTFNEFVDSINEIEEDYFSKKVAGKKAFRKGKAARQRAIDANRRLWECRGREEVGNHTESLHIYDGRQVYALSLVGLRVISAIIFFNFGS